MMISKIKKFISNYKLLKGVSAVDILPTAIASVSQEDVRTAKTMKEVERAFDKQNKKLMAMSRIPHEKDCDFINCKKAVCFKFEPDKIVEGSQTIVELKKDESRQPEFYD